MRGLGGIWNFWKILPPKKGGTKSVPQMNFSKTSCDRVFGDLSRYRIYLGRKRNFRKGHLVQVTNNQHFAHKYFQWMIANKADLF